VWTELLSLIKQEIDVKMWAINGQTKVMLNAKSPDLFNGQGIYAQSGGDEEI